MTFMARLVYDKKLMRFKEGRKTLGSILWLVVKYAIYGMFAAVIYYVIFSFFISSEREKKLSRENRLMSEEIIRMKEKMDIVESAVSGLEERDRLIYNDVFHTDPPKFDFGKTDVEGHTYYEYSEKELIEMADLKARHLENLSSMVERWFESVEKAYGANPSLSASIPSILPIKNFSLLQTGASKGMKVNPFFKTVRQHNGIDLMAPVGTEVVCTADGVVIDVEKSAQVMGCRVTIAHGDGYVTTYSHLSGTQVRNGQKVSRGTVIAWVGASGNTFAPCLHYEILKNGEYKEPVNYFFADLTPAQYNEMLVVAMTTGQSMD